MAKGINSKCKGPEVETSQAYSRNREAAGMASGERGREGTRGQFILAGAAVVKRF